MNDIEIMEMIKRHECYRDAIYEDTGGILTGGWGHSFQRGQTLPEWVWAQLFVLDYDQAVCDYNTLDLDLDPIRRGVVIDMLFNMGLARVGRFVKFIRALNEKDFQWASREMEDSNWYMQVGNRAKELVEMMRSGHGCVVSGIKPETSQ